MKLSRRWSLLASMLLLAVSASAQWKNVAPNLVHQAGQFGAMQFRAGVVWAGGDRTLWYSTDTGAAWNQSAAFPISQVKDVAFYDRTTGIVTTKDEVYVTSDGGKSWIPSLSGGDFRKAGFGVSAQAMYVVDFNGSFWISMDAGQNWHSSAIGIDARSFAVARDGTIYLQTAVTQGTITLGIVIVSSDFGQTWTSGAATLQFDCYTLAVDSCNTKLLFLVNEQLVSQDNPLAKILVSTDGGQNWNVSDSHPWPYYSGAMTTNNDVIFLGMRDQSGVRRSMDKGQTWKSIGGPILDTDTRNLAVVNDNTILAADSTGSIWLTTNGGGDSVAYTGPYIGSTLPSVDSLFVNDTVRCDSLSSPIYLTSVGCRPPHLSKLQITGQDATSFHVAGWTNDSITVVMNSQQSGPQQAVLIATREDGSQFSVILGGYSAPPQQLSFNAAALNVKTDTIGGEVAVPIKLDGLLQPENVELVMHYELPNLVYDSSVDRFGTKVDVPGEQWPGRSKLLVLNDTPGTVTAYAKFQVFSDTVFNPHVTFDSVNIPTTIVPCEYSPPPAATATIFPLQGCVAPILSRWIHLDEKPLFRISPNPTSGSILITSTQDVGAGTIDAYDMMGTLRARYSVTLSQNVPTTLSLPLPSGAYYLRIITSAGEESVPVVVNK